MYVGSKRCCAMIPMMRRDTNSLGKCSETQNLRFAPPLPPVVENIHDLRTNTSTSSIRDIFAWRFSMNRLILYYLCLERYTSIRQIEHSLNFVANAWSYVVFIQEVKYCHYRVVYMYILGTTRATANLDYCICSCDPSVRNSYLGPRSPHYFTKSRKQSRPFL